MYQAGNQAGLDDALAKLSTAIGESSGSSLEPSTGSDTADVDDSKLVMLGEPPF